ncbi:START-like domain-containing protein [Hymenobacter nivis]|uniref:ATPase n=1 Tax=Hymenobacter nivis TaxID=1850093 RepID=A0A502GY66_9BACT|nr:START-like domain-containing protein [Hymenobacter nivis]TPG65976.1 ATPase [Hymenobacter nivis]
MALPDTQTKSPFVADFPINASPKILFPYLATAAGLARWFCDDVNHVAGGRLNFVWDRENHYAEVGPQRLNRAARYVFSGPEHAPVADPSYVEFTLHSSAVTDEVFLHIVDYSSAQAAEQRELWDGLVARLREQVGG